MKKVFALACLAFLPAALFSQSLYFPPLLGNTWDTLSPDSLNWCPENIDSLYQFLDDEQTDAFIILKDGKIVLEKYFGSYTADSSHIWYSAGKSLVGFMIGQAQEEGLLDIENPTSTYLGSGWTSMPSLQEDSITVRHQLSMSTGLDESDFSCTDPACLIYKAPAGTRWYYHNAPYSLLRDVLESASGVTINNWFTTRLSFQTGMTGLWIPFGFNNFFFSKARSMARFGLLVQNEGEWNGNQVLNDPVYWSDMVNTSQPMNPAYGYLWWLNGKSSFIEPGTPNSAPGPLAPDAPMDVFSAAGNEGQFISISPSLGLVVVRQGASSSSSLTAITLHNDMWREIMKLECDPTSVAEPEISSVSVFPNPTHDRLRIDWPEAPGRPVQLQLMNQNGQVVLRETGTTLDLSALPGGIYFLRAVSGQTVWHQRVVKL